MGGLLVGVIQFLLTLNEKRAKRGLEKKILQLAPHKIWNDYNFISHGLVQMNITLNQLLSS
jgi:hypothetical protein